MSDTERKFSELTAEEKELFEAEFCRIQKLVHKRMVESVFKPYPRWEWLKKKGAELREQEAKLIKENK
jgi:hypothetical protein